MTKAEAFKELIPSSYKDNNSYVYHLLDGDDVVYVGQTVNIKNRIITHMGSKIFTSVVLVDCNGKDANLIETDYIAELKPKYNKKDNPLYAPPIKEFFEDEHTELRMAVINGAKDNGIDGVTSLAEHCGVPYPRLVRIWKGDNSAKVADVITVLSSLGLKLTIEKE